MLFMQLKTTTEFSNNTIIIFFQFKTTEATSEKTWTHEEEGFEFRPGLFCY